MFHMMYDYALAKLGSLLSLSFLCLALSGVALAQAGVSSASASRTRYLSEMGSIPAPREVVVEEFINYHVHQIGRPKSGEAVGMDVRWGNDQAWGPGDEAVLQVGFSTALATDRQQLRPLNLALVIDKSGSMADADKMSRVQAALLALVTRLRSQDVLSIVIFDDDAQVLLPARYVRDTTSIKQLIREIVPGGSTNIHAGLMLGYQEARKYYRKNATNRVILLTDGIANEGVTDPERIARASLRFNDEGIDLSTIGVGLELNKDLLRDLAKSGRGLFHFVADAQDIEKVFINELQSLVSAVASSPFVEIDYDPSLELAQVYGYEPKFRRGKITIKLDNMNNGLTQVILLRFRMAGKNVPASFPRRPVMVRLSYYDLQQEKQIVKIQESVLPAKDGPPGELLRDREVEKNYSIALLAQAIREMAEACEARRFLEAENVLTTAITKVSWRYPYLEDQDLRRTMSIAQKYRDDLEKYNRQLSRDLER